MREGPPLLSGRLDRGGAIEVLRRIESQRPSGVLRYRDGTKWRHVTLVRGEIAVDQPLTDDSVDPVECFLGAREGEWEVYQELPPLPVSRGDASAREGSLAVHDAAGLMRYCERAGLTGRLVLSRTPDGMFPRRGFRCEIHYEAGELLRIRVDGAPSDDLNAVFAWEEGTFRVEAVRPFETEASGMRFVRVVEVELARVVESAEQSALRRLPRPDAAPPLPEPPPTRPRLPALTAPAPSGRDDTVKVFYLDLGEAEREHTGQALIVASAPGAPTRRADEASVVVIEPRGTSPDAASATGPRRASDLDPPRRESRGDSFVETVGWIAVFAGLFVGVVALLGAIARMR
ncbi:MAG: hypothetical protein IT379_32755 [Deltaproteobacteria bacterium]|nr:hypothetical protein [Deltaproteobacteria bacterium]